MNRLPEPKATFPKRAPITPALRTLGATSATRPPSAAVIFPSFTTRPFGFTFRSNRYRPAMKSAFEISEVVASRPPTSTWALR